MRNLKLFSIIAIGVGVWLLRKKIMKKLTRLTSFGGKDDVWDRGFGSAYLPSPKKGETPAQYYERLEPWQRGLMRPEMAQTHVWPIITRKAYDLDPVTEKITNIRDVQSPMGVSGFLNAAEAHYAAIHKKRLLPGFIAAAKRGNLWAVAKTPQGEYWARVVDSGPARLDTFDVSPAFQRIVKPHWPVDVEYVVGEKPGLVLHEKEITRAPGMRVDEN